MFSEEDRRKLIKLIMDMTGTNEKDAERIERIITKYPPRKILVAINSMLTINWRNARRKPISLDQLEKTIERVRW